MGSHGRARFQAGRKAVWPPWCPLSEVRAPPQQSPFTKFGKLRALANVNILVPLLRLKFLDGVCRSQCRNFKRAALVVEVFGIAPRGQRGRPLQELRGMMARFAGRWAFRRVASELGLQLDKVGENVSLE